MQYICLIYGDEKAWAKRPSDEQNKVFAAYGTYTEALKAAGKLVGGDALQPIASATTVRVRHGDIVTTDGPFAETKEQLGGYYVIEADDLDDAIAWAAKIPGAAHGSIEVRPLLVLDG